MKKNNFLFFLSFSCSPATDSAYALCKNSPSTVMLTGKDVLPNITTVDVGIGESFAALWAMIIGARTLFYLALKYLNKP